MLPARRGGFLAGPQEETTSKERAVVHSDGLTSTQYVSQLAVLVYMPTLYTVLERHLHQVSNLITRKWFSVLK